MRNRLKNQRRSVCKQMRIFFRDLWTLVILQSKEIDKFHSDLMNRCKALGIAIAKIGPSGNDSQRLRVKDVKYFVPNYDSDIPRTFIPRIPASTKRQILYRKIRIRVVG